MAKKLQPGHNSADLREPFIWEPGDWFPEEWKVLCKIFGFPPEVTEQIILHASKLEYFISAQDKAVDSALSYIITEYCPHCKSKIEMCWDTDTRGFMAFCPVCSNRLMLCDECQHTGNAKFCDYNPEGDSCRYST